jgi:DnaJ-class molecular chaperone
MDIFKMATQIANNMSEDDKSSIENMDIQSMITHVTQNVFKAMNVNPAEQQEPQPIKPPSQPGPPRTRDICFDLNVDLAEFYSSKKKKLNIKRKRIVEVDGKQKIIEEKKRITVNIERGMKDEQQIRFEGEADQIPGYIPGDVVITLVENEHEMFQRDGDNLIMIKNVNIYQIYDYAFDIIHLDDTVIRITKHANDSLHLNESMRKISGKGMPVYRSTNEYGDLYIRFNVVIPKILEPSTLKKLKEIFDTENAEPLNEHYTETFVLENITDTDLEEFESESDTDTESEISQSDSDISVSSVSSSENVNKSRYKR